jgi:hypothetical protein
MLCAQQRLNEAPMTADPDRPPMFRLLDPHGVEIAKGSMSAVSELILDSKSRKAAEALLCDAAAAVGTIDSINSRADAVIEREREVAERERRLQADAVQRFRDSIDDLAARIDAHEQARIADELARLPDPDDPRSHAEHGELEPHGPSHPADREVLEATLEREADDADAGMGDLPSELQLPAAPLSETEPAGLGIRSVQSDKRRFREPKPRRGRDWPAQPVSVSLTSE